MPADGPVVVAAAVAGFETVNWTLSSFVASIAIHKSVDRLNVVQPGVDVTLLVANVSGHLVAATTDSGTAIKQKKVDELNSQ